MRGGVLFWKRRAAAEQVRALGLTLIHNVWAMAHKLIIKLGVLIGAGAYKQIIFHLANTNFGNINMHKTDRVILKCFPGQSLPCFFGQARQAVALQVSMQL